MYLGKALCMLTEEMFKQRAPDNGDILYRTLKNLLNKDEKGIAHSFNVYFISFPCAFLSGRETQRLLALLAPVTYGDRSNN